MPPPYGGGGIIRLSEAKAKQSNVNVLKILTMIQPHLKLFVVSDYPVSAKVLTFTEDAGAVEK